jgi:hypothetical protein
MRLDHLIANVLSLVIGRLVRRAVAGLLLGLFVLGLIYHLTVAGTLGLAEQYGAIHARLIVAAIYFVAALVPLGFLVATRVKPATAPKAQEEALQEPRNQRLVMLLESILMGYSLAKKRSRDR